MTERNTNMTATVRVIRTILLNKWKFVAVFILAFLTFVWILGKLDLLPEPDTSKSLSTITIAQAETTLPVAVVETPTRIVVPAAGVDVPVNNPVKTDIPTLDASLLSGAVRYPTSAKLGEEGNVVIFGHSSYIPVLKNDNYKAFNGLENLSKGDLIEVYGNGIVYKYAVDRVYEADATSARIPLTKNGKKLTLSTCNTFGNLNDRHVVEATFVGSTQI